MVGKSFECRFYYLLLCGWNEGSEEIGPKGQIVIPKIIREYLGVKPGDTVILEVRERKLVIVPGIDPREFVEGFCSVVKEKLTEKSI